MVIGAGQMGGGIAQVMAATGHKTYLNDVSIDIVNARIAFIEKRTGHLRRHVCCDPRSDACTPAPVEVRNVPCFVPNQVLEIMINEAIYCPAEGVTSTEDIDAVMRLGMNHPTGPRFYQPGYRTLYHGNHVRGLR